MAARLARLPPPMRGIDGPGTFAYDSMKTRIPAIVRNLADVLDANGVTEFRSRLEELADSIERDDPVAPLSRSEHANWNKLLEDQLALEARVAEEAAATDGALGLDDSKREAIRRGSWMSLPWWFVENWLYRAILEITGWHDNHLDPFRFHKQEANTVAVPVLRAQIDSLVADCEAE
jgi:hypothetical protein